MNQLILNSASLYLSGRQLSLLYARDRDGQAEHGHLTSDRLYNHNWQAEAEEELIDALWYLTAAAITEEVERHKLIVEAARLHVVDALNLIDSMHHKETIK